ncbi:MAG: phthalate 3,4-dioxygenase, ferredoxin reductase subunit [Homoserinimonas sp.]|nr:phthalate 3,4-dioxygenase, ferredoxin reductase subunit [Homoserinimonas sp.]
MSGLESAEAQVVIVGASVAGSKTAQALRTAGYEGTIILVGADTDLPYDKPPLSKQVLSGAMTETENGLLSRETAAQAGIVLKLGAPAVGVDTAARVVTLADGETVPYTTLVVATGVRARPSPWGQPAGVHLLRTLDDARALRTDLLAGGRLVVIGGGFIGSEVSATASKLGMKVQIVDPVPVPMARILGDETGGVMSALHTRYGVETFFGTGVTDITVDEPNAAATGRPTLSVHLDSGEVLTADTVVVGIGTITNHEWLDGSGILVENGVVCDQFCRAVGNPDVYAVGDIARWLHTRHNALVRTEHWTTAVEQAQCVAHNVTHPDDPREFAPVEYVWSDQYEWKVQITGRTGALTQLTLADDSVPDRIAVLYSEDGTHYSGAMTVNWPKALMACRRAVGTGVTITELGETLTALLKKSSEKTAAAVRL